MIQRLLICAMIEKRKVVVMKREDCIRHGINYDDGVHRVVDNEELYQHFLREFPKDPSYYELVNALASKKAEEAFQAAHKLKGVAANLSLDAIYKPVCILVEELRRHDLSHIDQSFPPVKKAYAEIVDFITHSS